MTPMGVVAGDYLYVLGGYNSQEGSLDSVERAPIDSEGGLGTFSQLPVRLNQRIQQGAAVAIGSYLYVIGGFSPAAGALATIERARVAADGSLSPFEVLQTPLPYAVYAHSIKQLGNALYLLAGNLAGGSHVLRAQVYPDGNLGAFTRLAGSDLPNGAWGAGVEVFGNYLYRCGGYNGNGQANCNRAAINADGTLQAWQLWQPQGRDVLPASSYDSVSHTIFRWQDRAYWFSGQSNGSNIFVAPLR